MIFLIFQMRRWKNRDQLERNMLALFRCGPPSCGHGKTHQYKRERAELLYEMTLNRSEVSRNFPGGGVERRGVSKE